MRDAAADLPLQEKMPLVTAFRCPVRRRYGSTRHHFDRPLSSSAGIQPTPVGDRREEAAATGQIALIGATWRADIRYMRPASGKRKLPGLQRGTTTTTPGTG
jgi:hypothetical protein